MACFVHNPTLRLGLTKESFCALSFDERFLLHSSTDEARTEDSVFCNFWILIRESFAKAVHGFLSKRYPLPKLNENCHSIRYVDTNELLGYCNLTNLTPQDLIIQVGV